MASLAQWYKDVEQHKTPCTSYQDGIFNMTCVNGIPLISACMVYNEIYFNFLPALKRLLNS